MTREQQPAIAVFSAGMIAMGLLSIIYRDFAFNWQPVPVFPGRQALAIFCGIFMIAVSMGLLFRATSAIAARAIFVYLIAWLCLKVPAVTAAPQIEGVWIGFGEVTMLFAGGWILFALLSGLENQPFFDRITGQRGIRLAQILFGLAVIPVALGHLFYPAITASLVPSWMPFRLALAYLTGFAQIACGLAIVFSFYTQTAAFIETALLTLFAFLVWGPDSWFASVPRMPRSPQGFRFPFTAFLITWVIGAAALLIAATSVPDRFSSVLSLRKTRNSEVGVARM